MKTLTAFRSLLLLFLFGLITSCAVLSKSGEVISAAQIDPSNPVKAIGQVYAVTDAVSASAENALRNNRISVEQAQAVLDRNDRALALAETASSILDERPADAEEKLRIARSILLELEDQLEQKVKNDG